MNKFLKYYYIDTLIIIICVVLNYCLDLDQMDFYGMYGSGTFFVIPSIFIIISLISIILNIIFLLLRYRFNETNTLFPKYFLMFFILVLILGIIYNQFAFLKGIHVMYYFTFVIIGYSMLSVYTTLSFQKIKPKQIKKNK